jgi:predicted DNA-binding protein (UPF0278 family)
VNARLDQQCLETTIFTQKNVGVASNEESEKIILHLVDSQIGCKIYLSPIIKVRSGTTLKAFTIASQM